MTEFILATDKLFYYYPDGTMALDGISVQLKRGKKIAVLGANGAGKTTLFLHWNGVLRPAQGTVYYQGSKVQYHRQALLELRKNVGIVFQDPDAQLFSADVYQEVSFGALNLGYPPQVVQQKVEQALQEAGITYLANRPTHFLSYGQKKMVSIADILVMEPQVIILDEPTAYLDPLHAQQTLTLLDRLNNHGTTVIVSTHDVDMACAWADEILIMKAGRLLAQGEPVDIFTNQELLQEAELTKPLVLGIYEELVSANVLPACSTKPRTKKELIKLFKQQS